MATLPEVAVLLGGAPGGNRVTVAVSDFEPSTVLVAVTLTLELELIDDGAV
jgi:hypothetical protein